MAFIDTAFNVPRPPSIYGLLDLRTGNTTEKDINIKLNAKFNEILRHYLKRWFIGATHLQTWARNVLRAPPSNTASRATVIQRRRRRLP